jgi:DNA invertase Pin-like site-specific DNA recombinase
VVETERGKQSTRPQLARALAICRGHRATLLIARLDRLARNVHFISGLMETGVPFVAADMPTATPFMLHIYAAMAEAEGIAISTRTKAALAAAKARGVKLGNPRLLAGSPGVRFHRCVANSRGTDDCSSEFGRVRWEQSDFESAVSNYQSECR